MSIEYIKELFKLVSSLDKDWNGNKRASQTLVHFLEENQMYLATEYVEASYNCVAVYNESELHLLRHRLINEILIDENKEKRKYFVYKHTVPNGKVYIGITCCTDVELRWYNGFGYSKNELFYADIKKFGWNNITHEILYKNLTPKDAQRIEMELIKEHRSSNPKYGYNLDVGGRISTTPYIWTTWKYDLDYQFRAKRRPFKVIVDTKDLKKFEKYVSKYDGEIIECIRTNEFADQYYAIATNPSHKEKEVRKLINTFLDSNSMVQVEYFYGAMDGLPFEFNVKTNKLIVRFYVIDKRDYKLENVIEDLSNILNKEK